MSSIAKSLCLSSFLVLSPLLFATEPDQLPASFLANYKPKHYNGSSTAAGGVLGHRTSAGLLGIDSLLNWSGYFYFPGVDGAGNTQFSWTYTMVGRAPFGQDSDGGTTSIPAPIVPVIMDLRNADGTPRLVNGKPLVSSPAAFVSPTLNSPVFQNANWDPFSQPTQYTDALYRTEFGRLGDDPTHTLLKPAVKSGRTMMLKRGTYRFALNPDGTCCAFILADINSFAAALFPPTATDRTTVMGQAENAGDVKTSDISTFLFPNVFLWQNGDPMNCCVVGFHTYDLEPGDASNGYRERRYVMNYSSWVSPGIFTDPSFADVATLSHEMSELFHDPFVNNTVPWWLSPNGNCQNNLEGGDVIEGLPKAIFPITLKGVTYHVQNEALLEWFAGQALSSAVGRAYSYPDKTVLTMPSVSRNVSCQ